VASSDYSAACCCSCKWLVENSLRADDPGGVGLGDVGAEDPGHAEVGDLGVHVAVQEDVAGLEVPVDDPQPRVLVQVEQALRDAVDDPEPPLPGQGLPFLAVCTHKPVVALRTSISKQANKY